MYLCHVCVQKHLVLKTEKEVDQTLMLRWSLPRETTPFFSLHQGEGGLSGAT